MNNHNKATLELMTTVNVNTYPKNFKRIELQYRTMGDEEEVAAVVHYREPVNGATASTLINFRPFEEFCTYMQGMNAAWHIARFGL